MKRSIQSIIALVTIAGLFVFVTRPQESILFGTAITSSNYSNCKVITVDNAQVDADLSGFPVLIDLTDSDLATSADSDGGDIVFTDSSGEILPFEIELYDSGRITAWASTTLSSSSDTDIHMYYGTTTNVGSLEDTTGVWDSNYIAVWHLPDGNTLSAGDSTDSGFDGSITNATATSGQIDGAASFNGSSAYINVDDTFYDSGSPTDITVSLWTYHDTISGTPVMVARDFQPFLIQVTDVSGNNANYKTTVQTSSTFIQPTTTGRPLTAGQWHYIVLQYSSSDGVARNYLNGVQVATASNSGTLKTTNLRNITIGNYNGSNHWWPGLLDEVRISNASRSADWIATEYNNQSATSTFYSISSEFDNSCTEAVDTAPDYNRKLL